MRGAHARGKGRGRRPMIDDMRDRAHSISRAQGIHTITGCARRMNSSDCAGYILCIHLITGYARAPRKTKEREVVVVLVVVGGGRVADQQGTPAIAHAIII